MLRNSIAACSGRLSYALLFAVLLAVSGCAGSPESARQAAAGEDRSSQCRAAIDDISEFCAGEGDGSPECEDAKARSRDLCM